MKGIEISFRAKDSELGGWEYTILEGMEAVVEGGKVIVRRKESEDERIRKNCIHFLELQKTHHADTSEIDDCIAYLEKQKEQKPAEWSEEYREEDLRTRFAFYTYKDEDSVLYLSNVFVEETSRNKGFGTKILAAAEKVAETLGAIQIRLKVKQDSPANAWYRKNGYGYMAFEDGYDWLEKTLEYLKPVKQEWSEEDEKIRSNLMLLLANMRGDRITEETYQKYYPWLKSLKNRGGSPIINTNSFHWKPSEEQIAGKEDEIRWRLISKSPDFAESGEQLPEDGVKLYKNINAYMVVGLSRDGVLSWTCNHANDSYRGDCWYLTFDDLMKLPKEE